MSEMLTAIFAAIFVFIYSFFGRPYQITGAAMSPTYNHGEFVMTTLPGSQSASRGDVIVFKSPTDKDRDFIKRVIGLPGEEVFLEDGQVFINKKPLEESYILTQKSTFGGAFLPEKHRLTIPEDHYFVLGDNRMHSSDSREWGFLPKENIIGTVKFCYSHCDIKYIEPTPYVPAELGDITPSPKR